MALDTRIPLMGQPLQLPDFNAMAQNRMSAMQNMMAMQKYGQEVQDKNAMRRVYRDAAKGLAYFPDEPTPFQGLKPEVAKGYIDLFANPKSTVEDLAAFAKANGFSIDMADARTKIAKRNKGAKTTDQIEYAKPPRLLTDSGDGATGSFMRGVGDPINMLDELGAVVDTLGGTPGRLNVFNTDQRFGDLLWQNIDQNRSVLGYDEANHPYARFAGQIASGVAAPAASVEGVSVNAFRKALEAGATNAMARDAARRAVVNRLAVAGAGEGALAGAGAGEDSIKDRVVNAMLGAGIGAVAAPLLGAGAQQVGRGVRGVRRYLTERGSKADDLAADAVEQVGNVEVDNNRGAVASASGRRTADMAQEGMDAATITGPEMPEGFVMDGAGAPPAGFVLDDPKLSRQPSPLMERATPDQLARVAEGTDPGAILPIPRNEIESLDEAMRANPGARQLVKAPNEREALPSYQIEGKGPKRRDPLDLVGWLRTQGGIRESRGDLAHLGIDNAPRNIEFAKSEGFLGKLVRDDGMDIEDAAVRAWEQGWFPDMDAPPTAAEFMDALDATHKGGSGRIFHPDDFETLDAYRAAQRDRNAIEQAEQEGRPIVREVGKPVSMADLDANQPPATAYEDLPAIGGKVGNIRVDKLGSSQDIARALQTVDNRFGGFDAARRGKIAQAETKALAEELNMTADDLLKRRRGQALNAEQALAARAILAKSGDELVKLARKAQGGADEDLAAFRAGLLRHAAIQEQVSGATAEAGRALAQFRMDAPNSLARGRMLKAVIDSAGGRDRIEDVAEKILELEKMASDPADVNEFARKVLKPGFWDMAKEYWINALLSGPRTHATNIGSNLLTSVWSLPEHAATAAIGKLTRSDDRMLFRDVGARAVGMMEGARDGLRLARKAFMTGEPTDGVSQVEAQQYRAIPGKVGSIIRTPTRALMAEDEFFKSVAYRGELNALAARAAYRKEGLSPAERTKLYEQLRGNPTDSMIDQAVKASQYQTFQAPLKGPGVQIQMLANKGPMKLFLPFVRTPLNLLKYATERSPLAPVLSEFRDAVRKGGVARDQAMARVAMGSGLAALATSWALDGKLSGSGPTDPRQREALMNTGWKPFSVKVGDKWYSYQRIDPFARVLSTAADFATFGDYMTDEERQNTASAMAFAVARNISTMPTLDPAASAFEALSDPDRYLARYAKNLAASAAVPNIVTQINSTIDPYMRETDTLMDTIKSRVPGMSEKLPARMNLWGQPIARGDALGPDIVSPIWESVDNKDKALAEVNRLGVKLSKPDRTIGKQRLTADQYARLVYTAGQPAKAMLDRITASPQWDGLPDGAKRLVVKEVVERFRKIAKARLLSENPDLLQAEAGARIERKTGEPWKRPAAQPPIRVPNAMASPVPSLNAMAQ